MAGVVVAVIDDAALAASLLPLVDVVASDTLLDTTVASIATVPVGLSKTMGSPYSGLKSFLAIP